MEAPKRILFVCTGNICRSAMAEHLLRRLASERGLALETASCGTAAESYYRVPAVVHRLLTAAGVPPFEHRPRLATRETLRWADLILVMTAGHYAELTDLYPEFTSRIVLFREASGFGPQDVEDPMGRSDAVFAKCMAQILESLERLLRSGFRPVSG